MSTSPQALGTQRCSPRTRAKWDNFQGEVPFQDAIVTTRIFTCLLGHSYKLTFICHYYWAAPNINDHKLCIFPQNEVVQAVQTAVKARKKPALQNKTRGKIWTGHPGGSSKWAEK